MWPTWWWPQALMQPEILIFSSPISSCRSGDGEALGDALRDRDRAGIGERAIVEAGAGDDVGDQAGIGGREAVRRPARRRPPCRSSQRDMRQDEVLLVADAHLVEGVALGEVGDRVHLLGGGVARRAADRLQRDRHRWRSRDAGAASTFGRPSGRRTGIERARASATSLAFRARRRAVGRREIGLRCARSRPPAASARRPSAARHSSSTWRAISSTPVSWTRILMRALYLLSRRP